MKNLNWLFLILMLCSSTYSQGKFLKGNTFLVNKINKKSNFILLDSLPTASKKTLQNKKRSKENCLIKGDTLKKQIALTFDDGPTNLSLEIIKLLNKYNAKGTFFWLGKKLKNNQETIKLAKKSGHLIANHSWNHQKKMEFELTEKELWEHQIEKTFKELKLYGVKKPKYYRPPYGGINKEQIDFLAKKGITTVLWSLASKDWTKTGKEEQILFDTFKNEIHNGAIVLLHDFDDDFTNNKLKAVEKMLVYGITEGYTFVTLNKI